MKLSDKPEWVDFIEKDKDEVLIFCHRCGKDRTFEGHSTIERGVKYANEVHGKCEEKQ